MKPLTNLTANRYGIVMKTELRPLHTIAKEIRMDWSKVYFGAVPYLDALAQLRSVDEMYGQDTARSIVIFFLANANTWLG